VHSVREIKSCGLDALESELIQQISDREAQSDSNASLDWVALGRVRASERFPGSSTDNFRENDL
jgi:hypothetical protein